jgi:hypothetical protein
MSASQQTIARRTNTSSARPTAVVTNSANKENYHDNRKSLRNPFFSFSYASQATSKP